MLCVEKINNDNMDKIISFLTSVPSISTIDENIIKNSAAIIDDDKVVGSISFEQYDSIGLIRYFVFKRNMSNELLKNMIDSLNTTAIQKGITELVCIADNVPVFELFTELGFKEINKNIFINEEKSINTSYGNSDFLSKRII
ncbi:MAG: hypothetical protein IJA65_00970 [Acholeplasmatales bacterium]|nr:hypothetical protein [Acholeplasmatales bacterium]